MLSENIARIVHEANRAMCEAFGDYSQKPWDEAEQWQRDGMLAGVAFHLANPFAPPSASHNEWMDSKKADGWVYGEVKDPEKKTHPCLIAYDDLPPEQQAKDIICKALVRTCAEIG